MPRAKKKIEIITEIPADKEIKEFQERVNLGYVDMIRTKLSKMEKDMKYKLQLIDGLISGYEE